MLKFLLLFSLPSLTKAWFSQSNDWLVSTSIPPSTSLTTSPDGSVITLSNGLISSSFIINPCFATVEYIREDTQNTFLHGVYRRKLTIFKLSIPFLLQISFRSTGTVI